MKTEEQIAKVIEKSFSKECKGVSVTRNEFIHDNIAEPLKKFFDEKTGRYLVGSADREKLTNVQLSFIEKFNSNIQFREASADYLLQTSIGNTQHGILQQAVFKYADLKEDTDFLRWVFSNHKLDSVSVVCTDTTTRLNSFLTNLYKDYVSGKKELSEKKAAAKAAKEAAKEAAKAVKVMSDEEINAQLEKLLAEKKKREEKKIAK